MKNVYGWLPGMLCMTITSVVAQINLSGEMHDNNGQPLPFANVLLLQSSDSSLVKGAVTTAEGKYTVENIAPGDYLIAGSSVGYRQSYNGPVSLKKDSHAISFPPIILEEDIVQLGNVVVEAKKPVFEQQLDRLVVNVQNSITLAGGSALDALEKSPGVSVNRQNNSVSLNGKNGVLLMVNNKISRVPVSVVLEMLSGINADNIEKIEIITTPPANFDAEGDAGIIHVVMKKNTELGTNGSFGLNAGYGQKEKAGTNFNFNHFENKVNFYADYSGSYNNSPQLFRAYRKTLNDAGTTIVEGTTTRGSKTFLNNARVGLDIEPGKNTSFGGLVAFFDRHFRLFNSVNDSYYDFSTLPDYRIVSYNNELNHQYNYTGNLYFKQSLNEKANIAIDLDYVNLYNHNPSDYIFDYSDENGAMLSTLDVRVGKDTPLKAYVGKLDFTTTLGEKLFFETGVKSTLSSFVNDISYESLDQGQWVSNPFYTSTFTFQEGVYAAYTSFTLPVNEKVSIKGGLRYEYTDYVLENEDQTTSISRKYGTLFPTLFVSRKFNQENSIQLSYAKRVTRPSFWQLAPFILFTDPYSYVTGNPTLQPTFSDNIKVDYLFKGNLLGLQFSRDVDVIAGFQPHYDPETNSMYNAAENLDNQLSGSVTLSTPFQIAPWWEMQNVLMGNYSVLSTRYMTEDLEFSQWNVRVNNTNTFPLPKQFTLQASFMYNSPSLFGVVLFRPTNSLDVGISKKFRDGGSLRLSGSDLLYQNYWGWTSDNASPGLLSNVTLKFETRVYRLSYTKSFGTAQKSRKQRQTGTEELNRRLN